MKKWIWIGLGVLVIAAVIYFVGPNQAQQQAAQASNYQTETAQFGSLTATVGATGVVHANQTAFLVWQTTGTVAEVQVGVGDPVEKDEVLASLAQTSLSQQVILAQADLVTAQRALDDLMNSQIQSAQAQQAVEQAERALEDAQNPALTQARAQEAIATAQKAVENAERVYRYSLSPASQSMIDEAQARVTIAKDSLDRAAERFEPYAGRPEDNLTRAQLQSQLSAAQQQYDAAVRNLNSMQGTASATDQAVAEANLISAQAQFAQAQRDYERVKDGANLADIALLEAQLEDARREWERVKDGPDPDDLRAAEARRNAAQATLDLARLAAPFSGTITVVDSKPGDQVTPGTSGFRLDDLSHLLIDVRVSEVDINRIRVGQDVTLGFDAIQDKVYNGRVVEVDLVGSIDQGVVDFNVSVELTDADADVKTGMTAAVNIVVEQLDNVLLVPNRAVRISEGNRVVYILQDGNLEEIEINLGASSESSSQVLEGDLQSGDLIVLNPPLVFNNNGGPPPFMVR
ncbi:MAG TPA: efflux RND transporter periplasmic adaptor subunit [Anaerolineales bacterium]|nr:efflux RND transporter periplasmic adaptor subunit [Anaerolineales bacterium]